MRGPWKRYYSKERAKLFPEVPSQWTRASGHKLQQKEFLAVYVKKKIDVSFLKCWNRGPERCGSVSLGLLRFDYKRPSAAWSCFEVNSAGSRTRWPTEIPSNLNYSTILRKWGLCFMNRHRMVQQTNTTKEWKVIFLLKIKHFFSLAKIWVKDFLSNTRMYFLAEREWCKRSVPAQCRCSAH